MKHLTKVKNAVSSVEQRLNSYSSNTWWHSEMESMNKLFTAQSLFKTTLKLLAGDLGEHFTDFKCKQCNTWMCQVYLCFSLHKSIFLFCL